MGIAELMEIVMTQRKEDAAKSLDHVWYIIQEAWWDWQENGEKDKYFDSGFLKIYDYLRGRYGYDVCDESGNVYKPNRDFKLSQYTASEVEEEEEEDDD